MRCQWGTTWENLQPWIAARRYREFEVLDSQVSFFKSALLSSESYECDVTAEGKVSNLGAISPATPAKGFLPCIGV